MNIINQPERKFIRILLRFILCMRLRRVFFCRMKTYKTRIVFSEDLFRNTLPALRQGITKTNHFIFISEQ